jgi:hypothetical protein
MECASTPRLPRELLRQRVRVVTRESACVAQQGQHQDPFVIDLESGVRIFTVRPRQRSAPGNCPPLRPSPHLTTGALYRRTRSGRYRALPAGVVANSFIDHQPAMHQAQELVGIDPLRLALLPRVTVTSSCWQEFAKARLGANSICTPKQYLSASANSESQLPRRYRASQRQCTSPATRPAWSSFGGDS